MGRPAAAVRSVTKPKTENSTIVCVSANYDILTMGLTLSANPAIIRVAPATTI